MLICATFHVREDWLRNGEGSMFEQELEQELEQLKHLFGQLRPEFKEYVLKELQNLLELRIKRTPTDGLNNLFDPIFPI